VTYERTLALDLAPEELEMALASNGASLQEAVMMAIISALTLDTEVEALANLTIKSATIEAAVLVPFTEASKILLVLLGFVPLAD